MRTPTWPSGRGTSGIIRAVGTNSERKRFQSRAWPGSPEITSYSAARIDSMLSTSFGAAAGADSSNGWSTGGRGAVCASVAKGRARHSSRARRRMRGFQ